MDLTELGKELLGSGLDDASQVDQLVSSANHLPSFLMSNCDLPVLINVLYQTLREHHWDAVTVIPPGFQLLASSAFTPIQSIVRFCNEEAREGPKLKDRVHIIGFQGSSISSSVQWEASQG